MNMDSVTGITAEDPFDFMDVLSLEPGDTLVFKVDGFLTVEQHQRLMAHYGVQFPENRILILDQRTTVGVLKNE